MNRYIIKLHGKRAESDDDDSFTCKQVTDNVHPHNDDWQPVNSPNISLSFMFEHDGDLQYVSNMLMNKCRLKGDMDEDALMFRFHMPQVKINSLMLMKFMYDALCGSPPKTTIDTSSKVVAKVKAKTITDGAVKAKTAPDVPISVSAPSKHRRRLIFNRSNPRHQERSEPSQLREG